MVFYCQKEGKNNITLKHIAKYERNIHNVPIKLLITNKFRLLFTYNADSIRDFTSLWGQDFNCYTQQANCQQSFRSTTKIRHPE